MATTKMNIGVSLSKNYNTIKLEFLDKEVEYESQDELKNWIQHQINFLKAEINKAHEEIADEKKQ